MKIAIYGDSFGSETPVFQTYHKNLEIIGDPWPTLLKQDYIVANFCESGSDHYFSFYKFLTNYKNYDLNIFIETSPFRLSTEYENKFIHNHNIDSAKAKLKIEKNQERKNILLASVNYFLYLQNDNKDKIISKLFREKIKTLDPNCFIIDAFGKKGLFNITLKENQAWDIHPSYTKHDEFLDLRYCHMTQENNFILYKKIKESINSKIEFKFNLSDYKIPNAEQKTLYLVKK